jgi:uracil DNA glycosylase
MVLNHSSEREKLVEMGRLLQQSREVAGFTMEDLGKKLGMRSEQIQAIEEGNTKYFKKTAQPLIWFARIYAKKLKVDLPEVVVNPQHPDLSKWSKQGVLLLNTALTTVSGKAGAHSKIGWEEFTFEAIVELAARNKIVLICWGARAISLGRKISKLHSDGQIHLIESAHPSPLSARNGFFGSKPFSRTNSALKSLGLEPIDWSC